MDSGQLVLVQCRYCPAKIGFIGTHDHRRLPVEPELRLHRVVLGGGPGPGPWPLRLVTLDGMVLSARLPREGESAILIEAYEAHWGHCPGAARARKARRKGKGHGAGGVGTDQPGLAGPGSVEGGEARTRSAAS